MIWAVHAVWEGQSGSLIHVVYNGKYPGPAVLPLPGSAGWCSFPFPHLSLLLGSRAVLLAPRIPPGFALCLMAAVALFTALPVPISGRPINPDRMAFPCKRQFVKICLWAAVTISMGFISSLFTVCAHVYAALLSHHNPKLDCSLDSTVTCSIS